MDVMSAEMALSLVYMSGFESVQQSAEKVLSSVHKSVQNLVQRNLFRYRVVGKEGGPRAS